MTTDDRKGEGSGYHVISMKKDWQTIYGEGVVKTGSFHWLEDLTKETERRT